MPTVGADGARDPGPWSRQRGFALARCAVVLAQAVRSPESADEQGVAVTVVRLRIRAGPCQGADALGPAGGGGDRKGALAGGCSRIGRGAVGKEQLDARRAEAEAARTGFRYDRRCYRRSPDEVAALVAAGTPFTIRFFLPDEEVAWEDAVHGRISFQSQDLDDFVILRSDGTAIYNLAVVSDAALMPGELPP